jgi:hypothetical protein
MHAGADHRLWRKLWEASRSGYRRGREIELPKLIVAKKSQDSGQQPQFFPRICAVRGTNRPSPIIRANWAACRYAPFGWVLSRSDGSRAGLRKSNEFFASGRSVTGWVTRTTFGAQTTLDRALDVQPQDKRPNLKMPTPNLKTKPQKLKTKSPETQDEPKFSAPL